MSIIDTLLAPVITEKSTRLVGEGNKYTFMVDRNATKNQVKEAVKKIYGVKVKKINIINMQGKTHRIFRGRKEIRSKNWKKAIVELVEGQKIKTFEFPTEEERK